MVPIETRRWRQLLPFALGAGLVGWVLSRVDWQAFVFHLAAVNYVAFLSFVVVFVFALLTADVVASLHIYRRFVSRMSFTDLFVVRAASYLPSLLNHHVGQAWLTYLLSKVYGMSLKRVAGATLLIYVTWGGCMILLAVVGLTVAGFGGPWMVAPLGAGLLYLLLLWRKPQALAKRAVLEPLFEAGVGGHLRAMAMRVPHIVVLFLGTWLPFLFFDIDIPIEAALTYVPALMVAVTLPLTPMGVGTRDALAAQFFLDYVAGADTADEKRAALAAATTALAVALTLVDVLIGVLMMPRAAKLIAQPTA
ncbi:flippase-like domain-containing protein [Desulfobulbus sp. AH-315-M07]|nr:flippase-like domain-containing protein [Desulfobulbus sp. AH-315-M07]